MPVDPSGALRSQFSLVPLADPADLDRFRSRVTEILDIDFPSDYWQRCQCLALVNPEGAFRGGAMVAQQPPFRSLESIPEPHHLPARQRLLPTAPGEIAEVNGLWLEPGGRDLMVSLAFSCQLAQYLIERPHQQFLFTFDPENPSMAQLHKWLDADILYSGLTRQLPGMRRSQRETIALVQRSAIARFGRLIRQSDARPSPAVNDPAQLQSA